MYIIGYLCSCGFHPIMYLPYMQSNEGEEICSHLKTQQKRICITAKKPSQRFLKLANMESKINNVRRSLRKPSENDNQCVCECCEILQERA